MEIRRLCAGEWIVNPRWIIACCRILLSIIFILASLHKILFPESFALAIYHYQLLPDSWINWVALTLPWIEFVAAIAILCPLPYKQAAAWLMLILLGMFSLAMSFNILRGLDISCGCFSSAQNGDALGWGNVMRNLGYMVLATIVICEQWLSERLARP